MSKKICLCKSYTNFYLDKKKKKYIYGASVAEAYLNTKWGHVVIGVRHAAD